MYKFSMGQKVKLTRTVNGGHSIGKVGMITAIYDKRFTPGQYPTSDYRVTFGPKEHGNNNQYYAAESDLDEVQTIKAYCFVKDTRARKLNESDYIWRSSIKAFKGYKREPLFDIEKEIVG